MQYYHLNRKLAVLMFRPPKRSELEVFDMSSMLKTTVLSIGLLAGTALAAQAQSVSSLPPAGGVPQTAVAQPSYTSQLGPNPGKGSAWSEEHYQAPADYAANPTYHPYSTSIGPKPGANSSIQEEHYKSTDQDSASGRHPYTATGVGPKPGGG